MGVITDIQRFCTQDGPGIRTTIFFKGCPLHCLWCHNPETQNANPQIYYHSIRCTHCGKCALACKSGAHGTYNNAHAFWGNKCNNCLKCVSVCDTLSLEPLGKELTVAQALHEVKKDAAFYGNEGGMTLSGGEPMYQPEFALGLLTAAHSEGIHTCMETCGFARPEYFRQAARGCDLFLWDIKDTDASRHKTYTGVDPSLIHENLSMVDTLGTSTILRCIMLNNVNTVNTDRSHAEGIAKIFSKLKHCQGVELIKYHPMGGSKMERMGLQDNSNKHWIPSLEDVSVFSDILKHLGVKVLTR